MAAFSRTGISGELRRVLQLREGRGQEVCPAAADGNDSIQAENRGAGRDRVSNREARKPDSRAAMTILHTSQVVAGAQRDSPE